MSPHIPHTEDSERSCYASLLLHSKWINGEAGLLQGHPNAQLAVAALQQPVDEADVVPGATYTMYPHYKKVKERRKLSEQLLADTGNPNFRPAEVNIDDFTAMMSELHEETLDTTSIFNTSTRGQREDSTAPARMMSSRYVNNCSAEFYAYLNNFIPSLSEKKMDGHLSYNQCSKEELRQKAKHPNRIIALHDADLSQTILDRDVAMQNEEQSRGYEAAIKCISGEDRRQLFMFLTGEGGTGKSKLIHDITRYTQIFYGKSEGMFGAAMKTAPTGAAAFNIRGQTWHKSLGRRGFQRLSKKKPIEAKQALSLQKKLKGVKLFILDEVSLLSLEELWEISHRLCHAMGSRLPFGGLHVILAGDFYQMRCVCGTPIVQTKISHASLEASEARHMFVHHMTHFVNLVHNVRAQQSGGVLSPLAYVAQNVRVGNVIGNDVLATINTRVMTGGVEEALAKADEKAVWVTATHKRIALINDMFLRKFVDAGNRITRLIATHKSAVNKRQVSPPAAVRTHLYSIGKDMCYKSNDESYAPTHIDVCIGTRVRIVTNLLTECGLFNGAMGTVWGFVYEGDGHTGDERVPGNFGVLEDWQRELPIVLVRMDGTDESFPYSCNNDVSRLVPISPIANNSRISYNGKSYTRWQIPILPAHARTGHSVQGFTSYDGIVGDVGSTFFAGEYVSLSRATCITKVYLLDTLVPEHFLNQPDYRMLVHLEYKRLLSEFDAITFERIARQKRTAAQPPRTCM